MESPINFYKEDMDKNSLWLNKEYLVQLNLTGACPRKCDFCYISLYKNTYLSLEKTKKLWKNLRNNSKKYGIEYRVNLTGGDLFMHPEWKDIAKFISKEKTIVAMDPLINKFWKEEHLELLEILKNKINFVQLNPEVVSEQDIIAVKNIGKKVVLKIALYKGDTKKEIEKLKYLSDKFDNIIISVDLIIPQKECGINNEKCFISDIESLKKEVEKLKKIFGNKLWLLSTTIKREYLKQIFYCPIPFGGVYIMPNGKVVPCSRYSHLDTGFDIDNFDLIEYVKKFDKLCSNFCLFENKYFKDFWDENENPKNFFGGQK